LGIPVSLRRVAVERHGYEGALLPVAQFPVENSLPSMAQLSRLRIVLPGHPWPGVRGRSRCRKGIG
jgi:hypothetical protein